MLLFATPRLPFTDSHITGKIDPSTQCGAIAQLGERIVRNDEVVGSIPTSSTKYKLLKNKHRL